MIFVHYPSYGWTYCGNVSRFDTAWGRPVVYNDDRRLRPWRGNVGYNADSETVAVVCPD